MTNILFDLRYGYQYTNVTPIALKYIVIYSYISFSVLMNMVYGVETEEK